MKTWLVLLAVCSCIATSSANTSPAWSYTTGANDGPAKWSTLTGYAACGLNSQSPIDITTASASSDQIEEIVIEDFEKTFGSMTLKNNGHTAQVDVTDGMTLVNKYKLSGTFKLTQFHLHWAQSSTTKGSEHKIDGKQYFGEFHAVFFNTKYSDLTAAAPNSDGIAVFGVFLDVDTSSEATAHPGIKVLTDNLGSVTEKDQTTSLPTSSLKSLKDYFPTDTKTFYRYSGSLTTPACYESVKWSVLKNPIMITEEQATSISSDLKVGDSSSAVMTNNFRPLQALNGRKITISSANIPKLSMLLVVALCFNYFI